MQKGRGIGLGIIVGVLVGIGTGNIGVWLALGIVFGAAYEENKCK